MKHNYLKHLFTALLLLCTTAAFAHDFEVDGIYYNVLSEEDKTVEVTYKGSSNSEYSNEYTGSVVIPESVIYNGVDYSVTSIGSAAFKGCKSLTNVIIPNSVTSIGVSAFNDCNYLTNVTIGNNVTSIGNYAFCNCNLTSITFPSSVTSIGEEAFYHCTLLTSVVIPSSVTSIGNGVFSNCIGLTSVVIEDGVTNFGDCAFSGCTGLTSVTIPNSVTTIGNSAFYGCSGLTSIVIPNSVTSIGWRAFDGCTELANIEIPNSVTSIGGYAFNGCSGLTSIEIPNSVTTIGRYAFEGCKSLTSIEIPNSVTSIGEYAFCNCSGLTSVEIPNSITSIGNGVFWGCSGLTSVVIPNSVINIGEKVFCNCTGLTSVEIPNSVTSIGMYAFNCCKSLTSVEIPNSVTSVGEYAFDNTAWYNNQTDGIVYIGKVLYKYKGTMPAKTSIVVKEGTWVICDKAFNGCTGLTNIEIPNSVTSIGNNAFQGCTGLTNVQIPNSVTSIGDYAFRECTGITSVTILSSVTSIGSGAFRECTGLKSVVIEDGVTNFGDSAFYGCSGLTSIEIPNSVTSIGYSAFYGCKGLTSIVIPNSVTSIGSSAFYYCSGLKTVINLSDLTFTKGSSSHGYVAYYADKIINGFIVGDYVFNRPNGVNTLVAYLGNATELTLPADCEGETYVIGESAFDKCSSLTSVTIPNSVTSIGDYAFRNCSGLTSIVIPNSVTSIGGSAFYNCSGLTSIEIPNSVTSIGSSAFYNCKGLRSIEIPNSVTSIPNYAFRGCTGVASIEIPNSVTSIGDYAFYDWDGLTSVVIPNSVTSIGNSAFYSCSYLKSIVIGNSVTSIGASAFYKCSGITSITIPNSVTSIGSSAFNYCTNLKTVMNFSNITFSKGSSSNGYVAYYADKVYNAPNGSIEGDFLFSRPNDVNTLVGYLGNATELILPENYKGENYSIGDDAFYGYTSLTSVVIPSCVTSIGSSAFNGCSGLTSVEIPNSVTSIGDEAFYGCIALKTVINNSDLDIEKGSTSNGYVAYYADEVITNEFKFELIDGVYTLVKYKGKGIKQKEMITFDSWTSTNKGQGGSTSSYEYKFDATAGSKLSFDWSVSSEADYDELYVILDGTTVLTKSGEYSGNYEQTFTVAGSHTLEVEYTKDGSVDGYNDEAKIYNVKLTKTFYKPADVVLPDNYDGESYVIGESAFENNEYVASVTIPEGVEMICDKAFSGCSNLESIVIPNSMSAIGGDAFAGSRWYDNEEDGIVYAGNVLYKYKGTMPENTAITINDGTLGIAGLAFVGNSNLISIEIPAGVTNIGNYAFDGCTGLTSITSLIPAEDLFAIDSDVFSGVDKNACTLCVPYGAKETYATTKGWEDFVSIEGPKTTITINQYGCATYCSPFALDFSEVEGLKAYSAIGFNSSTQVVTLARVMTTPAEAGIFVKGEPGEYVVPTIEECNEHTLNLLVGTLEQTTVNSTEGEMSNYKFTVAELDEVPMFYPFEDNTTFSAGKAYLQIPTAWLPATAQKSVSIRFDEGETTDIDELKGESGEVKTVYDLQGRKVDTPSKGIYIINGKKVIIK